MVILQQSQNLSIVFPHYFILNLFHHLSIVFPHYFILNLFHHIVHYFILVLFCICTFLIFVENSLLPLPLSQDLITMLYAGFQTNKINPVFRLWVPISLNLRKCALRLHFAQWTVSDPSPWTEPANECDINDLAHLTGTSTCHWKRIGVEKI